MNKATLTLLAASGMLGVLVLLSNPAHAAGILVEPTTPGVSAPALHGDRVFDANLRRRESNPILDQLGCKCAVCVKASAQLQGKLPF